MQHQRLAKFRTPTFSRTFSSITGGCSVLIAIVLGITLVSKGEEEEDVESERGGAKFRSAFRESFCRS